MYKKPNLNPVLFAVMVLLSLTAGIVSGATVTQSIMYQGKLTNAAGSPLTGTYTVTLKLYDAGTGGTTLSTDTHSVTAANGLFTTSIGITDPAVIDGRAIWLGIKVGTDPEMTPRQEIRPVPYALGLRPGAVVKEVFLTTTGAGTSSSPRAAANVSTYYNHNPGIKLNTTGINSEGVLAETYGSFSEGVVAHTGGQSSDGVQAEAYGDYSSGVRAQTSGSFSEGVIAHTGGDYSKGVYAITEGVNSHGVLATTSGTLSDGVFAQTGGDNSEGVYAVTYGIDSEGVRAESAKSFGVYGKGKEGAYFTTNAAGMDFYHSLAGVNVSTEYSYNPGIRLNTTSYGSAGVYSETHGYGSEGVIAQTYGYGSEGVVAQTYGVDSEGVVAQTYGADSPGVVAHTYGTGSVGVYGQSTDSPGVFGKSTTMDGVTGGSTDLYGVSGYSTNNAGVYGSSSNRVGVYGTGKEGGYFTTNTAGTYNNLLSGVNVTTGYAFNPGVVVTTAGGASPSIWAHSYGDYSHGLYSATEGTGGYAMYAHSNQSVGLYAVTNKADNKWGVYSPDYIGSGVGFLTQSMDVAEFMPVTGNFAPGTVLAIGEEGKLGVTSTAYDTRVAGIVSTAPGVTLGNNENGNYGEAQIAVAGRVPCRVDAGYGAIHAGDLLTTSNNPGYAMKAEPVNIGGVEIFRPGTVLGKAMGTLDSGTGTIEVLVTLQ